MAKKSQEQSGIGGWVAAGVFIAALAAHNQNDEPKQSEPDASVKHPQAITVDTRLSVKRAEELFGCDIQDRTAPDPNARHRANEPEKDCAKHIAFVIGKNSYGWDKSQQKALEALWTRESQWSANADNPNSSAYGIPQAMTSDRLHGPELAEVYGDGEFSYYKNPVSQIQWGLKYIHERYGNPEAANEFWYSKCGSSYGCWY